MANITFNSKVVNLWQLAEFTKLKKINHSEILSKAFDQKVLFAEEKQLLEKFINFIKNKKMNSSSQIFQDIFAEFIIGENFNKTFLEFGATNGVDLSNTLILEKELGWKPQVTIEKGIEKILQHIDYWREAPVWTPDSIADATKDWFKYLGK